MKQEPRDKKGHEAAGILPLRDRLSPLSHDLRSALSDVLGGLKLIDARKLDAVSRSHFERVTAAAQTVSRLVDTIKTAGNDQPDDPDAQAEDFYLAEFLEDIRKRWGGRAEATSLDFSLECQASLPAVVTVERVSLDRIIGNLIGNAIKYSESGTVRLAVTCDADRTLAFKVTDEGAGFPDVAPSHSVRGSARDGQATEPGNGLGLLIARDLSTKAGATLRVANRADGPGAEAVLSLPVSAWHNHDPDRLTAEERPVAPVDLGGMRILLAEDNRINQLVVTRMLDAMGAECAVASDGFEALDMLKRSAFDLVLLDIEMPRMSGLDVIGEIRAGNGPRANLPLIALTAYVMREHRDRILAAGADGIIAKPLIRMDDFGLSILRHYNAARSRTKPAGMAGPASPTPDQDVVEREVFARLVGSIGPDSTIELLRKLQTDTQSIATRLASGWKSRNLAEIRSQTHILISVAGAIGANRLLSVARRLNAAAKETTFAEIDDLCQSCLSGISELRQFISQEQSTATPDPDRHETVPP